MNPPPELLAVAAVFCVLLMIVLSIVIVVAMAEEEEPRVRHARATRVSAPEVISVANNHSRPSRRPPRRSRRRKQRSRDDLPRAVEGRGAIENDTAIMIAPELGEMPLGPDIQQLVERTSALLEDRPQTFFEWWNNVDVVEVQLAKKIEFGRAALVLIKQRTEIMASVGRVMLTSAEQRRHLLETQLASTQLEEQIALQHELRDVRRDTQRAIEEGKQRKLLEPARTRESVREQVVEDRRADLQAQLRAGDQMLRAFLQEVHLICESRASIHERALRLQNLLNVFELGEEALPADAIWILRTSEKLRDAS